MPANQKNTQSLKALFEGDYPGKLSIFENLIKPVFVKANDATLTPEQLLLESEKKQINSFEIISQVRGGFPITFADVEVKDSVHLKTSRVAIRNCVLRLMQNNTNTIIFFHFADTSKEWRISFVHKGDTLKDSTTARRYTYLCGQGHSCRTVADRFETLKGLSVIKDSDLLAAFSVESLTKEFYQELFAWYTWACELSTFPKGKGSVVKQTKDNNEINLIRLITRLMFVWFIKQKDLIPSWIFDEKELEKILAEFDSQSLKSGNYYNAVIQNLFFATLNKTISERSFTNENAKEQYGIKTFYRDDTKKSFFKVSHEEMIEKFKSVPFLNGGLFECLDRLEGDEKDKNVQIYSDGFSREKDRRAFLPNALFFMKESEGHEGLISILNRYNFTVEENTPSDVQVALDPELLGKVFENLLGTYNPETSETARKDSGSFYTPRTIVNFMVNESVKNYLKNATEITDKNLEKLFDENTESLDFESKEKVVEALKKIKILDPACGSGAFPMGILQCLVSLIKKLDPKYDTKEALYKLKLDLIENCIFGSDIQTIAVQICKLRFFITLICEQDKTDNEKDNYGFNPLPNLETKFVCANSLIGISKNEENMAGQLFDNGVGQTRDELKDIRSKHFKAQTSKEKMHYRALDKECREKLVKLLEQDQMYDNKDAKQLASWSPYDQNATADFFDEDWMFGITDGFDIVIGNPPYIQLQKDGGKLATLYENEGFESFAKTGDIYCLFYEKGFDLLKPGAHLCYITSNKWMRAGYGEKLRDFFAKNTNPKMLIDFAGVKVFESATVDTNILLFQKAKNQKKTLACVTKNMAKADLNNMSHFIKQNSCQCSFATSESWVVLSSIEQSIKQKIEKAGTPLKDWDIQINYGIKTGFNDAFIISSEKRGEILNNCKTEEERKKTDELIRPILRGRDIKRYGYDWAGLWLINTHNGIKEKGIPRIDVEKDYPAVKKHLDEYWDKIEKRADQGDTPYNLRNCAYMDDFFKQKIVWGNLNLKASYAMAPEGMFVNAPCPMIVPANKYLLHILNSKLADYYIRNLGVTRNGGYFEYKPMFIEKLPVPLNNEEGIFSDDGTDSEIDREVYALYGLNKEEIEFIENQKRL